MKFENLVVKQNSGIAMITINRPAKLNALNKATIEELNQAFTKLEDDSEVRVILITGAGDKAFVAGADISEFASFNAKEGAELAAQGQKKLFDTVENLKKPVIAAVNGFALGGGLELAMACHFRVASFTAKMGLPETSLGLIPGYGGTQRLAHLVGKGKAMEMIMTAGMLSADEANSWGLVNHVVEPDELTETCVNLAQKIMKNSPRAIEGAIRSINAGFKDGEDGYATEIKEFGACFGTEDFKEGTSAFLNKRKAEFKGK